MKKLNDCTSIKEIAQNLNYDLIAYILLMLWSFNPTITYVLQRLISDYTVYIEIVIRVVGFCGILFFILYVYKDGFSFKKLKENKTFIFLILLLFWGILSTFFAADKNIAIFGEDYRKEGLITYIFYIGFLLSAFMIKNKKYINNIIKLIILNTVLIVIVPSLIPSNNVSIFNNVEYSNIYFQFNHYGYYLMISTCLSLFLFFNQDNNYKKIITLGIYTIILMFLILNNTFGCILSFTISLILLCIYSLIYKWKRKDAFIALLIHIILSLTIFDVNGNNIVITNFKELFDDGDAIVQYSTASSIEEKYEYSYAYYSAGTDRMCLWENGYSYVLKHPIVGGGIENMRSFYWQHLLYTDRPHNIFLQISAFIGIPGLIFYILFILSIAIPALLNLAKKDFLNITFFFSGMCYFISSMVGNSMFYTSPYFMIILGFLLSFNKMKKNS